MGNYEESYEVTLKENSNIVLKIGTEFQRNFPFCLISRSLWSNAPSNNSSKWTLKQIIVSTLVLKRSKCHQVHLCVYWTLCLFWMQSMRMWLTGQRCLVALRCKWLNGECVSNSQWVYFQNDKTTPILKYAAADWKNSSTWNFWTTRPHAVEFKSQIF